MHILKALLAMSMVMAPTFAMELHQPPKNATTMLTLEQARNLVQKTLGQNDVLQDDMTTSEDFGYVFYPTQKKYLETGDEKYLVPGQGGIIVDKETGELHQIGSLPPELALQQYAEAWRKKNRP